jgi:hypothetical protein
VDAWHFVNPALSALSGDGFYHTEGGSFLYPAFLYTILRVVPDFRAISIVQHVMGMFCGLLLVLSWQRVRVLYAKALIPSWVHDVIGLVLMALCLLAGTPIQYEHSLRPEAVTCFFAALSFLLLLEFVRVRFLEKKSSFYCLTLGGLAIVNSVLLFLLKPSYSLTMFFASAPILISLFDRKEPWRRKCLLVGPALCVVFALCFVEYKLSREDKEGKEFLPATLFTIHADLIADQMQEDLSGPGKLRFNREWLTGIHAKLCKEIDKTRITSPWPTLGFNPDYLLFEDSICSQIHRDLRKSKLRIEFYNYYYRRTFEKHPLRMICKIARQMRRFYSIGGVYREFTNSRPLGPLYSDSSIAFRCYPFPVDRSIVGRAYIRMCVADSANTSLLAQWPVISKALDGLAIAYLPVLLLNMALALACVFHREFRRRFCLLVALAFVFYSYNFGNCIATSIVHTLSVTRYIQAQFVCTLFSETVGVLLLAEVALWLLVQIRASRAHCAAKLGDPSGGLPPTNPPIL